MTMQNLVGMLFTFAWGAAAMRATYERGNRTAVSTRTCPDGLTELRSVGLPELQSKDSAKKQKDDPYTLLFRVVEAKAQVPGFLGPSFEPGLRYLIFDEHRQWGLSGQGCVVQSKVACKHHSAAASAALVQTVPTGFGCGTPCENDVSVQFGYVKWQLGAVSTALHASHGKTYSPANTAVIGVGAGSMPNWLLARFPNAKVDAVDLEQPVLDAAVECFGLGKAEGAAGRLTSKAGDGIAFLEAMPKGHYDVVLFDVAPSPPHFKDAMAMLHDRIAPGGVFVVNGWAEDTEFGALKKNAAKTFARTWTTKVAGAEGGNEVMFAIKADADGKVKALPAALSTEGEPKESADWFNNALWYPMAGAATNSTK